MINTNPDLGAALFKTWNETQKKDEIAKLVQGYRAGVPAGILCKMAETIAGSRKKARKYLHETMKLDERQAAVAKESSSMQSLLREYLL